MKVTRGDVIYLKKVIPAEDHIQGGVRPYVVVSNDKGNLHSDFCMAVPLTSKTRKAPLPTHTQGLLITTACVCVSRLLLCPRMTFAKSDIISRGVT